MQSAVTPQLQTAYGQRHYMTTEELEAALNKATAALEKAQASIEKLERKNEDVIGKLKAADARVEEAEEKAAGPKTDLQNAIKRAETAEKAIKDAEQRAADLQATIRNKNADSAISGLLATANVDSRDAGIVSMALRSQVQFDDEGEPLIGGKSVADYGKEFFGSKGAGHHYVRAANNGGGVAMGSDGTKSPVMTKDTWSDSEFAKMVISDPQQAKSVAIAAGKLQLAATL